MSMVAVMLLGASLPVSVQAEMRIAFQSNRDSPEESRLSGRSMEWEIYALGTDGSGLVNLTNHAGRDIDPAWSPDGSRIAFASDRRGQFQIYVMNEDGSEPVQLTRGPGHHVWPAWSPDGTQLAYASNEEGDYDIFVMAADGSEQVNLTQDAALDYSPSWSADGEEIVFASTRDRLNVSIAGDLSKNHKLFLSPSDILVISAVGGRAENLTLGVDATYNREPAWFLGGHLIAYVWRLATSTISSNAAIVLLDRISGTQVRVAPANTVNFAEPAWSPDGRLLAYSATDAAGRFDIYLTSATGGEAVNLTRFPGWDAHPTWRPASPLGPEGTSVEAATWGEVKRSVGQEDSRRRRSGGASEAGGADGTAQ